LVFLGVGFPGLLTPHISIMCCFSMLLSDNIELLIGNFNHLLSSPTQLLCYDWVSHYLGSCTISVSCLGGIN
jgi:hypothetical protein